MKLLDEEMDGVAAEQRQRLETIEEEFEDVKRRLGRICRVSRGVSSGALEK